MVARNTPLGVRIRALMPELTGTEQRVAGLVLADPAAVAGLTIGELAAASDTSTSTVLRFCKALDLHGYRALQHALTAEVARSAEPRLSTGTDGGIDPNDRLAEIVAAVAGADVRAIAETAAQLDLDALAAVVDAMAGAYRVDVFAVGGSAQPAAGFQARMAYTGIPCWAWSDVHTAVTAAALLRPGAVAVGVSHSGRTVEVIEALDTARSAGATTVALTNFPRSPLAEVADLVLTTAVREGTFRPGELSGVHPQTTVLDCVYAALAQRDRAATEAALHAATRAIASHRTGGPRH
ncbi:MurR/RpiR family transcriptional regulator [Longispora sp. NPDC051575]|uniref:MurR/RpiR family transcriptional regulator n=1 Tax=Longispora sp. NPDC051575 TaxID=3154943 RepID=UPI0034229564